MLMFSRVGDALCDTDKAQAGQCYRQAREVDTNHWAARFELWAARGLEGQALMGKARKDFEHESDLISAIPILHDLIADLASSN